ncbi:MAG TPA: DUF4012 domain-containing protein [Candidatus Nanoarchaeia archaeon]
MPITHVEIEGEKLAKRRRKLPWLKIFLGVFVTLFLITSAATVYFYPKIKVLAADLDKVSSQTQVVKKAVEEQNVTGAKESVLDLRDDLEKTQKDLSKLKIVSWVPIISGYYKDAEHALRVGVYATEVGEIVADTIIPFGDILGLKGVKSNLKAEEKVEVLVTKVFPTLSKRTEELEAIVEKIETELDQINASRYSENLTIKGVKIHKVLVDAQEAVDKGQEYLPIAKNASETLPSVLGYKKERTYLLWFQNDKELRPTGGFITSYAIARVKNGKLLDIESDDIYNLDKRFVPFEPPPEPLRKYLLLKIYPLRDTNISPDYKISAQKFESFYERIPDMPKIDGIIAIDTELVRKFLEITGPITVEKYNETFSAEDHPVYKIPDVVYKLELYAERLLRGKHDRKGIIGDLMDEMLEKLLSAPSEKFPLIFETFIASAESKNILFYFKEKEAQRLAEDLNYAGRIKSFDGDYLHVNNANFAGLKGNLYIKALVVQDIVVAEDGTVNKKVTVTLRNTEKADGWLNSVYQNWMRIYVPKGSKLLKKEVFIDFAQKKEFDKIVWESFSRTMPLNFSETSFSYRLPFKVEKGQMYKLLIQKQGGSTDPHMIIRVNGNKLFEFDLKKDTELEFNI